MTHTPADLAVWEAEAEETCRAIPPAAAVPPAQDCVPEGLLSGGHGHDDGAETVVVERTAGAFKTRRPAVTAEQLRESAERAMAEEAVERVDE